MQTSNRSGRLFVNVFLIIFLVALLIDALPVDTRLHRALKAGLEPLLDITGTWQPSWKLFAPEVDKENVYVSAKIHLADGRELTWRSPRWDRMSIAQRFRHFRHMEYFDKVRLDENAGAWTDLARYLADRTERVQEKSRVTKVVLIRHWTVIPPPPEGPWPKAVPYLQDFSSFEFHTYER